MLFLLFYPLSIIISVVESYSFTFSQKHGRCTGRCNTSNNVKVVSLISFTGPAINYHIVQSFRECHNVCASDWRCCHFSYHISKEESHPDHAHCFLYSAEECDLASLVLSDHPSLWRTGRTARCQLQTIYPKRRRLFGSEFVG